ncbi:MAG: hypothetical protein CK425_00985 [Parachlamydia sp.]|nr:MAG: hypothetical protein CK425_00985 [Parachlamydia sp.]
MSIEKVAFTPFTFVDQYQEKTKVENKSLPGIVTPNKLLGDLTFKLTLDNKFSLSTDIYNVDSKTVASKINDITSVRATTTGGSAPQLTTGSGGSPQLTTGSGGSPQLTTGSGGSPQLTTGSGGSPQLTTGSGGSPQLTTGSGG